MIGSGNEKKYYIGDEAHSRAGILSLSYPIQNRLITDWDDLEKVWAFLFHNELRVDPEEHSMLQIQPPLFTAKDQCKATQIAFETFGVCQSYIGISSVLSLYAYGKSTGVVLDSGKSVSHVVPVHEGIDHRLRQILFISCYMK